jgi:hypothetical protein
MATRANDVIGADVADAWITWRKGCRSEGASKVRMSASRQLNCVLL